MKAPKRKTSKKPARSADKASLKPIPKTPVWQISPEEQIIGAPFLGKVKLYDSAAGIITLVLENSLAAGNMIRIKGRVTDLTQRVELMRAEGQTVQSASAGETVSIHVADPAREGDAVYKI
jgi:hypothetical protein